jgi:alcohol dehydrogenase class IV
MRDPQAIARQAREIGAWDDSQPLADAPSCVADHLEKLFASLGMPTRLRELEIPREGLPKVLDNSLKNFNADPKREFVRERELLNEILQQAW